jgi:[protein-PII] uridylyltransferase
VAAVAERVWYPIWDRGIRLDHSVRTVAEAVDAADGDLKVALGLLDARHVAGDPRLTAHLTARIASLWRARARRWVPMVRVAAEERHARFGELAFLLEPDVKECRGGLRDVAALRSVQRVTTVLGDLLVPLDGPATDLLAVRRAAHLHAGRAADRLLLQDQDDVAALLHLADADALLGRVSAAARTVSYVWDACWRRVDGWLGAKQQAETRPLGMGVAMRDGEVHVHDANRWLAAAAAAAERRAPLATSTLERLAETLPKEPPDPWPYGWRQSFVALLGAGRHAVPVLEALDHHGLLARLLPEWQAVRCRPQRNPYHRFTVDRHLMEAAANAAALTRQVGRPDLLLLGALLHDIGKGFPGDHTEAGVAAVRRIGPRMGLPPDDIDTLAALVEHHLLLPEAATRRDVDDPATSDAVVAAVGTPERLELLHALTEADSLATGPSAWSPWKASLVARLVQRAMAAMEGVEPPAEPDVSVLLPAGVADGLHLVQGEAPFRAGTDAQRCVVVAPDRPGLFSRVAGVLAMNGLDVLAATAGSAPDGRAVEAFDVQASVGGAPDWDRVRSHLDAALAADDTRAIDESVARRARTYARRRHAAPARVIVDNGASARATVVEVRAPDDVGVLYRITRAIAAAGLDVRSARASTLGHEVVDAFYVVGDDGRKVTDPARLEGLETAILAELRS